jgi:hypothetical protein
MTSRSSPPTSPRRWPPARQRPPAPTGVVLPPPAISWITSGSLPAPRKSCLLDCCDAPSMSATGPGCVKTLRGINAPRILRPVVARKAKKRENPSSGGPYDQIRSSFRTAWVRLSHQASWPARRNLLRLRTRARRGGHRRSARSSWRQVFPRNRPPWRAAVASALGHNPNSTVNVCRKSAALRFCLPFEPQYPSR